MSKLKLLVQRMARDKRISLRVEELEKEDEEIEGDGGVCPNCGQDECECDGYC